MKSVKQQYIDLKEGKMTQAQFMRNVRMSLPEYITNVTSFNDTVKILRNKAILTEADIKDKNQEKLEKYDQYTYTLNGKEVFPELAFFNNILKAELDDTIYRISEPVNGVVELNPIKGKTGMYTEADIKSPLTINGKIVASFTQNGDKSYSVAYENGDTETIAVSNDIWDKINMLDKNPTGLNESYTTNTSGKELYSRFAEVDNLNGQEVLIGTDYELAKNNNLTRKEATKIVIKNLKKNQFYYTDTLMSGVEGYRAQYMNKFKPGSDQMKDVKSNDLVDKTNGMTSPKGIEKDKASSNKAKKETNEPETGIKLMSLVAKTVRGVKKMDATGEKMKKLALKEVKSEIRRLADKIHSELVSLGTTDSKDKLSLITKYASNVKGDDLKDLNFLLYQKSAEEIHEYSTLPGGDNMTDVAGHQMDEAKASSLSVGDKFKIAANLGKFVMGEEVEVISLEPFGNDIKLVLSNGKDEDDFYLDRNDEI